MTNEHQTGGGYTNGATWIPGTAGTPGTAASATATLSPEYQRLRDEYLQQAYGFNGALKDYNPDTAAASLYAKLQAISDPQRQSSRNEFESRLLAQGQMGLQQGGVNPLSQSYQTAENMSNLQRELSAFGLAQDVQDRLLNRSMQSTTAATGIDALPLQQLSLGGVFVRTSSPAPFGTATHSSMTRTPSTR